MDIAVEAVPLKLFGTGVAFVMKSTVEGAVIIMRAGFFRCVRPFANTAEPTPVRTLYDFLICGIGGVGIIVLCVTRRAEPAVLATHPDGVRTIAYNAGERIFANR